MRRSLRSAPLMVCPPDEDPLEVAARALESHVHRGGWDQNNVFVIMRRTVMDGIAGFTVIKPPMPSWLGQLDPAWLCNVMADELVRVDPEVIGFMLVAEVWITPDDDESAEKVEARRVIATTVPGRDFELLRVRGNDPVVVPVCPVHRDPMLLSLRRLAAKAAQVKA